jgi:hypothetical protein
MNARDFFMLVAKMRKAQRDYFRTRLTRHLHESKEYEQMVDDEIKRVEAILKHEAEQQQMKLL